MSVFLWQPSHSLVSVPQLSSTVDIHSAALTHTGPAAQTHQSDKLQWKVLPHTVHLPALLDTG